MAKYKIKFTLLLAVSLFLNIASAFADSEDRPVNVYVQQPGGPMDVIVHQAPRQAPVSQKFTYAQRLYDAGQLNDAESEVRPLCNDGNPEADKACYLLARVLFTQGNESSAIGYFNDLLLRYPNSPLIRHGKLAGTLFRAVKWLFDEHKWKLSGRYMGLLKKMKPSKVGELGRLLETKLGDEIRAYTASIEPTPSGMKAAVVSNLNHTDKYGVGNVDDVPHEQEARNMQRELQGNDYKRWSGLLRPQFLAQKKKFSRLLLNKAQLYPLLKDLLTEEMLRKAMLPLRFSAPASPFSYSIHHYHFVSTDSWTASAEERKPKDGWIIKRSLDNATLDNMQFPVFQLGKLNRKELLIRLGGLLNVSSDDRGKRRKLL